MKVLVRHGHFAFYPHDAVEIVRFQRLFKTPIFAEDDYFTFEGLIGLPRWSQVARTFGNLPAVATYEGRHAWEVMRENGFVYSLALKELVPILAVTGSVKLPRSLDASLAPTPLVQPGAFVSPSEIPANRLESYRGELDLDAQRLYLYDWEGYLDE